MAWIISDYSEWKRHKIRGLICSGAELSDEAADLLLVHRVTISKAALTVWWWTLIPGTGTHGHQLGNCCTRSVSQMLTSSRVLLRHLFLTVPS